MTHISLTVAPGKLRTFTIRSFRLNLFSKIRFTVESPAFNVVSLGKYPWLTYFFSIRKLLFFSFLFFFKVIIFFFFLFLDLYELFSFWMNMILLRSSRPEVFVKKGVLTNFAKFAVKHLFQSLFFNKVAGLRLATLLKKKLWLRCFPVNFENFLRRPFLAEHLRWLLSSGVTISEINWLSVRDCFMSLALESISVFSFLSGSERSSWESNPTRNATRCNNQSRWLAPPWLPFENFNIFEGLYI